MKKNYGIFLFITMSLSANFTHFVHQGKIKFNERNYKEAAAYFEQALQERPDSQEMRYLLGNAYVFAREHNKAVPYYKKFLECEPRNTHVWYNLGYACDCAGEYDGAQHAYEQVLALDPEHKNARGKLWVIYLRNRDWQNGKRFMPHEHWWFDEDIRGKTVLVHYSNHGFGDAINYIRYTKYLHEAGARVYVVVAPQLVQLISNCPFIDKVFAVGDALPEVDHSCHSSPVLQMICKPKTMQDDVPYIFPDDSLVSYWKYKLQHDKQFKIGLCWQTTVMRTPWGERLQNPRSIPLEKLSQLGTISGVSFYSLQRGFGREQIDELPSHFQIKTFDDFDGSHGRFMDTAALMKNLDLVITVDTSIAHLAGALGVPTWTMLPYNNCWRWFRDRTDSLFYPSMRLFKQRELGEWDYVATQVYYALQNKLAQSNQTEPSPLGTGEGLMRMLDSC